MNTTFNIYNGQWMGTTVDKLPKHDLVFGTPINDPLGGLPLGDGDMGSLLWMSEDSIHIHVNKTDLWDDSSLTDDTICSGAEEDLTCLRHGGEIAIKLNTPCFDMLYQDSFEARLALADATARIHSNTPFSKMEMCSFASTNAHTTVLRCQMITLEPESPEIVLSRFGSRNLWRWYERMKHVPTAGLAGTNAKTDGKRLYITQELNGTVFCIGAAVLTQSDYSVRMLNSHSCSIVLEPSCEHSFDLFYTISLGKDVQDAQKRCATALDESCRKGGDFLHKQHIQDWADFWNRSFICIPDDYVENIYYLSLYYSNCECRGAYPPHFTGGIWNFRHDFIPWNYYFFYNMQHMYGPLNAAGHGELAENYYLMRKNGLAAAYRYAKKIKNLNGAFYHDVTDRYGRGAEYDAHNFTPAAQTAMAMWRYYRYTGDENFLQEIALPVMDGAAELYFSILNKEDDGLYHLNGTTAYEGNPPCRDSVTDMSMIRALFQVMRSIKTNEERERYDDVLNHLPEFVTVALETEDWDGECFQFGIGAGHKPETDGYVLAMGIDDTGVPLRRSYGDPSCARGGYGFPDVELSPVYPSGLVGLAQKGTRLYDFLSNQLMLHPIADGCMHWCMMPLYLARMGMADILPEYLRHSLSEWQVYPNGFDGDGPSGVAQARLRLNYATPYNADTHVKTKTETYRFRYFDFETTPIVAQAAGESLLQSYDGILRICPAMRRQDRVAFRLYAEGGFVVQAEISADTYVITVEDQRGEPCLLQLPSYADTQRLHLYNVSSNRAVSVIPIWSKIGEERVLDLTAVLGKGKRLLLCSCDSVELHTYIPKSALANRTMKECIKATLGSPALPHDRVAK